MEGRWNASRSSPARARRRAYHSRIGCHRSFLNSSGNGAGLMVRDRAGALDTSHATQDRV